VIERHGVPLFELGVNHSVGEALAADPNAFQYTVTLQLMQYELSVKDTCSNQSSTCLNQPIISFANYSANNFTLKQQCGANHQAKCAYGCPK